MLLAVANLAPPHTLLQWLAAIFQIVAIDVVLAGDNAVVIALAVRQLERRQRVLGIVIGAGMAVVLRVGLTYFAAQLLAVRYVQLIGGGLVLWIAVKLLRDNLAHEDAAPAAKSAATLWSAAWLILVADVTMSIDNIIAVAGASKGSRLLLFFGLGLSIPLVIFASNLLAKLMDHYPIIVWAGAALLGWVGAEMAVTDNIFFPPPERPNPWLLRGAGLGGAALVVGIGTWLRRKGRAE